MTSMSRLAAALAALAVLFAGTGCTKIGCFEWTEAEGPCPTKDEALEFFGNPECGGQVESVDSEPEYDGKYCCYEITKVGNEDNYYACPVQ